MVKVESVFEIIGPIMIGPSSSHTAGVVRIGLLARHILGEKPVEATIVFHGSLAETYKGHGSDKAVIAGILGFKADDPRVREALAIADKMGLKYKFMTGDLGDVHPNTLKVHIKGDSGSEFDIVGSSIGGGNVLVFEVNGFETEISGDYYTLIAIHEDKPGVVAKISSILAENHINIARMCVSRIRRGELAFSSIEVDQEIPAKVLDEIQRVEEVKIVRSLKPV